MFIMRFSGFVEIQVPHIKDDILSINVKIRRYVSLNMLRLR